MRNRSKQVALDARWMWPSAISAAVLITLSAGCATTFGRHRSTPTPTPTFTNTPITTPMFTPTPPPGSTNTFINTPVPPTNTFTQTPTPGGHAIQNVWIILMENHNWSQIKGSSSAPYINGLLPSYAHAEQYYNPPSNHPSEPNYIWLESGTNYGLTTDNDPSSSNSVPSGNPHLAALLDTAGISWKSYQDSLPASPPCPIVSSGEYACKHNPFVFFQDITGGENGNDAFCASHNVPFTQLATDLSGGTAPRYSFITPNLCNDMHDSCAPLRDPIAQGDQWLQANLPTILNSTQYANGGVVFITWDEAGTGDGPIGMIVVSKDAKVNYQNSIHYDHSSTVKTLQEIFNVTPLMNHAADPTTNDLSDLFVAFP